VTPALAALVDLDWGSAAAFSSPRAGTALAALLLFPLAAAAGLARALAPRA